MDKNHLFKNYSAVIDENFRKLLVYHAFTQIELEFIDRQLMAKCHEAALNEDVKRQLKKRV